MRICIVGTGGVGKTTLVRALAKKIDINIISEKMRISGRIFGSVIGSEALLDIVASPWYPHFVFD